MRHEHCESLSLPQPDQKNGYYGSEKRKECGCATEYDSIEPNGGNGEYHAPSHQDEGPRVSPISFTDDHGNRSGAEPNDKGENGRKRDLYRGWFFWNRHSLR